MTDRLNDIMNSLEDVTSKLEENYERLGEGAGSHLSDAINELKNAGNDLDHIQAEIHSAMSEVSDLKSAVRDVIQEQEENTTYAPDHKFKVSAPSENQIQIEFDNYAGVNGILQLHTKNDNVQVCVYPYYSSQNFKRLSNTPIVNSQIHESDINISAKND